MFNDYTGKTLQEFLDKGYRLGEKKASKGYVSRKTAIDGTLEVFEAGGNRKGEFFVKIPRWDTTTFYYRQYLVKGE